MDDRLKPLDVAIVTQKDTHMMPSGGNKLHNDPSNARQQQLFLMMALK